MDEKTKERINECIRAGMNFKKTKETLAKEGITKDFHSSFFRMKQDLFPEEDRHKALQTMHDRREEKKKSPLPTKAWNAKKQNEVDTCVFAEVLNDGLFYLIPCPQQGLKIEDVKQINVGGAVVGLVSYYTDVNLNHPIIIFVTRTIMLVLKIRNMCYVIQEKYSELKQKAKESLPGQGGVHTK